MQNRRNLTLTLIIVIIGLTVFAVGIFLRLNLQPTPPIDDDTSVATGNFSGCSVYFTGTDMTEYGGNYMGTAATLMSNNFIPLGLQISNGIGGGITPSLLDTQDLVIVGAMSAGIDNELVTTISPYLAEAHDRRLLIIFDGNQFYIPNNFLSQYGVVGSGNIDLIGNGFVSPGNANLRTELRGQPSLCFTTPSAITQTGSGSRVNEVESYVCNYQHTATGVCIWSELLLTSGSSIHIMSSFGELSGHPSVQCGGDLNYIVDLHQRLLNYACTNDPAPVACGNGVVDGSDQCDDGNTTGGDGCSATCQTTTQCNDGVDNDTDGDIDCQAGNEDPGCFPNGNGGGGACNPADNTEVDTPSQCSDGIDNDNDGNIDCQTGNEDPGCYPDGAGGGGACNPDDGDETDGSVCGNGIINSGEQCDDGNIVAGDGCSATCQITTQCNDGVDNDNDGDVDCQSGNEDPGCFPNGNGGGGACNPNDGTETNVPTLPATGVLDDFRFLLLGTIFVLLGIIVYKLQVELSLLSLNSFEEGIEKRFKNSKRKD